MPLSQAVLKELRELCVQAIRASLAGRPFSEERYKVRIECDQPNVLYVTFLVGMEPKHRFTVSNQNSVEEMMTLIKRDLPSESA